MRLPYTCCSGLGKYSTVRSTCGQEERTPLQRQAGPVSGCTHVGCWPTPMLSWLSTQLVDL
jgi:hypothetical protein